VVFGEAQSLKAHLVTFKKKVTKVKMEKLQNMKLGKNSFNLNIPKKDEITPNNVNKNAERN
jgi:hypothetical protein